MHIITEKSIREFEDNLMEEEKTSATCKKYLNALRRFSGWLRGREVTKKMILEYREHLLEKRSAQTVNGELSAIHAYLNFHGMGNLKVRFLKIQRKAFIEANRELSEAEYRRLLETAKQKGNERLYLVMMTLCSTGIRVSERCDFCLC